MTFIPNKLKHCSVLALLLGVFPQFFSNAAAETVLLYDFEDVNGDFDLTAEVLADGIDVGDWSVISSTIRDFTGNPGRALASGGFSSTNTLVVPISVAEGQTLKLTEFGFDQSASASGPVNWSLSIADITVAGGATSVGFAPVSGDLSLQGLTGSFLLTLGGSGASSNAGTYRIDNFFLEGEVSPVPLPGALIFFVSACFGLLRLGKNNPINRSGLPNS